jgi:hypothetical protein
MPTKRQIKAALKKSLKHWNNNLEYCPKPITVGYSPTLSTKEMNANWFKDHANNKVCALCQLFSYCDDCPLFNVKTDKCCTQFMNLMKKGYSGGDIKRNVRAVRDRIQRELDKYE